MVVFKPYKRVLSVLSNNVFFLVGLKTESTINVHMLILSSPTTIICWDGWIHALTNFLSRIVLAIVESFCKVTLE